MARGSSCAAAALSPSRGPGRTIDAARRRPARPRPPHPPFSPRPLTAHFGNNPTTTATPTPDPQAAVRPSAPGSGRATTSARVALRFSRVGRVHAPFYRLFAVDSRAPRETAPLEQLGWYNPRTKETQLKAPAIKAWMNKGAKPSDTVERLLRKAMIIVD